MSSLIRIERDGILYGIVLRDSHNSEGVTFVTSPDDTQQVAHINHPKHTTIAPHFHNRVKRVIYDTQETLIVKNGKLKCNFYRFDRSFVSSIILCSGDALILISGGHGFEVLEDVDMIEVKQGPYLGEKDKERFIPSHV
jgi:hypothetical protein